MPVLDANQLVTGVKGGFYVQMKDLIRIGM